MNKILKNSVDAKIIKALDLEEIQKGDCQNISSGHKNLDLELPNGTWPQSCLIEMLSKETTASEMLLLIPTLKKIASQNKYLIMLAPPYLPYIPTFQSFGIREELILVVKTNKVMEKLWVIEQSIRNNSFGALLAWVKEPCTFEKLRKIQLLAKKGNGLNFIFRSLSAKNTPSPSPLRIAVYSQKYPLIKLDIIKRRGPTKLKLIDVDVSISMNFARKEISLLEKNYDLDCVSDIGKRKYTCQAGTISSRKYI